MLVAIALSLVLAAMWTPEHPYYDRTRAHHLPDGFTNRHGARGGKPLGVLLSWLAQRTWAGLPPTPSTWVQGYDFPVVTPDLEFLGRNPDQISVTWIGHATLLVQVGGLNILTDPHFSRRAFPVQWAGPQRRVPLPATLAELPPIDVVAISHSHYDHLDRGTIEALRDQPGGQPLFLAPLGVDLWLRARGVERIERFDWWESHRIGSVSFHFVPAQHWSSRTPFDRNRTLWGGWVVATPGFSFYFAGDTGYSRDFADIAERFGGFDLAAIPVGAYEPRWFMKDQHVNPDEAVQIHRDVRARRSVGIHWGTFELTDEALDAPIGALAAARTRYGIGEEEFALWRHGETRIYERR